MALMPEVQFLLSDPELGAHPFTVTRKTGKWVSGRLVIQENQTQTLNPVGIIVPPEAEQLEFFPEGDRRKDKKAIYTKTMLHVSEGDTVSDTIQWNGDRYRILKVERWDEYGFCVAYAVKE